MDADGTAIAPAGQTWVCMACGKTSRTKYGIDSDGKPCSTPGWDASCMLNSRLIPESWIVERGPGGRVTKVDVPPTAESGDLGTNGTSLGLGRDSL